VERVIHTLPERDPVMGVTSLDNRLYVLRGEKSAEQIEVYNIDSYYFLHCLTVPGLGVEFGGGADIVACGHNHCAYISNCSHNSVHRVALSDGASTEWPVSDDPVCLSVTYRHSVLVSCSEVFKVKEFSTDGQLLNVLTLPDNMSPSHAIQLSSGQIIACLSNYDHSLHRVCVTGPDGSVLKSFEGSGSQQMNGPVQMAIDRNGFVFVVDVNKNRVLLLSPQLTYVREVVSRKQLKWGPVRLHLDCDKGRLYIADNEFEWGNYITGRVVVYDI